MSSSARAPQQNKNETRLGGDRPAPAGLQRLQLLLHHLQQILHFLYLPPVAVVNGLNLRYTLVKLPLGLLQLSLQPHYCRRLTLLRRLRREELELQSRDMRLHTAAATSDA